MTCGYSWEGNERDDTLECGGSHECADVPNHEGEHECCCGESQAEE